MSSTEPAKRAQEDIEVDPSSYVDPNGFLFHHRGRVFRAIHRNAAPLYRTLIEDGTIAHLVDQHGLVPTRICDEKIEGVDAGLLLEHDRIEPLTYCTEWCPSMLRDAGRALIDLALAIVDRDMILQDCYPWNVLFRGTVPVVVDFTSITAEKSPLLWPAFEQFEAFFMRPLLLAEIGRGDVARALLNDNINGIGFDQFYRNADFGYRMRHPGTVLTSALNRLLEGNVSLKRKLRESLAAPRPHAEARLRRRFLEEQRARLEGLGLADGNFDPWRDYYAGIGPDVDRDAKVVGITRLLDQLKPGSVLDLGCNTGAFSLLAAKAGARVLAVDGSEACIERLYQAARKSALPITPIIANLFCPTPPGGYMAVQYPGLLQRARADAVLCLGLMHHLHVTGRQPFSRIAELLASVSARHLVFEFVAQDDDNMALLGAGRPIEYSLPDVRDALQAHFPNVVEFPSDRPTRRLLACSKAAP